MNQIEYLYVNTIVKIVYFIKNLLSFAASNRQDRFPRASILISLSE